jgi:Tol biopolymer transport system component
LLKRIIATALGLLLLVTGTAEAQYFGRNKVQYERFRFTILETPHFDVYYYPEEREAAGIAAQLAERWYTRLSRTLHHTFTERQRIILYASHAHFAQTSILPGDVPEGVGGFTDHLAGRVVLPFAAGLGETDHVLGHEIVHAFQRDMLRQQGRSLAMLPLWFSEGMAERLSVGDLDVNTRMWLRDAERSHRVPTLAQLDDPKYFPYRYGQALWSWLEERYGADIAARALNARSGSAIGRLQQATGAGKDALESGWREFVADAAGESSASGGTALTRVIGGRADDGQLNVGPALSPDGRFLVFLSERDQHAVDVFLADAKSGRVRTRLLSTATDPHFDALQFIESAGAWDLRSRSFVLATVRDGHPELTIFDMPTGRIRQRIPVPTVDQIFSPSWSPTGGRLVFSGMKGGVTDVYTVNLADGRVEQLTRDVYSDLQPAWSPDGSRIVFATDRFSSSIDRLEFGRYELGAIDWPSRDVRYLGGTTSGKNIDPHWCPDASCLYFVSDETGVSNLYRMDLPSLVVTQMTEDPIGVSGVTALSPAISVGEAGTRVAMSVYRDGGYQIRALDLPLSGTIDASAIASAEPAPAPARKRLAPPVSASAERVATEHHGGAASDTGLPASFHAKPYLPSLSLFSFGQPYLSAGGGAFGSFVTAGMSFSVGDLFGEQELNSAIQVGRRSTDFAVQTTYVNRRSRWNWAVSGSQIPWLVGTGLETRTDTSVSGDPLIVRDSSFEQQQHRQATAVLMYPFNRARRVELSAGLDAVTFSRRVTSTSFSGETLRRVGQATRTTPAGQPALSALGGAALVYDTAVFGIASPVMGERYRLGLTASTGDLTFATASADYRRYWPLSDDVSVALKLQEVARVGRDIRDPRLLPLVWTAREIVRGYGTDPVIERASRVSVANVELRSPLGAIFGHRRLPLPVELFGFSDWGRFAAPASTALPASVRRLWSAGVGARLDVAGFIFEFNGVHPIDHAGGWRLAVNFRPGF